MTDRMAVAHLFDRITVEPGKCGEALHPGMRISVRRVLELPAAIPDRAELLAEHPFLEPEDPQQALLYAAATVDDGTGGTPTGDTIRPDHCPCVILLRATAGSSKGLAFAMRSRR